MHQIINYFGMDRGGAERLAQQLHVDLRAAGLDARLVALETCPDADLDAAISLGLSGAYDLRGLARLAAYARRHIGANDILHAHLFPTSALVAVLARTGVIKVPRIFTEHNTSNRRRGHRIGSAIDRAVYGAFDQVVAISDGVEAALLREQSGLQGRTRVIRNGCELRFPHPPIRAATDTPTILSIGRLTPQKNFGAALEALAELGSRPFRYVVLGEGNEREALVSRARSLGLEGKVCFEGHRTAIQSYLLAADIFLMPSLWEGFGLAAVEAMNAALPVVGSNVPGLREVVGASGGCCMLIDPKDPKLIASALRKLLDAPQMRVDMGRRGFVRAMQFEKARMTDAYIATYHEILGRRGRVTG